MAQIIDTEHGALVHLSELLRECGANAAPGNLRKLLRLRAMEDYVKPSADDYRRWRKKQHVTGKGAPLWLTSQGLERVAIELVNKYDADSAVLSMNISEMAGVNQAKPESVERPTTVPTPISRPTAADLTDTDFDTPAEPTPDVATQVAVSNVVNAKIRVASAKKSLNEALAMLNAAKVELETIMDAMAQEQM